MGEQKHFSLAIGAKIIKGVSVALFSILMIWVLLGMPGRNRDNTAYIEANGSVTDYLKDTKIFAGYKPENHDAYLDSVENKSRWVKSDKGKRVTEFYNEQAKYQLYNWHECWGRDENAECGGGVGIDVFPVNMDVQDIISNPDILKDVDITKPYILSIVNPKTSEYLTIKCEQSQINDIAWGVDE